MNINTNHNTIKAFVPILNNGMDKLHQQLCGVLQSADIEVLHEGHEIEKANFAIIIVGSDYKNSSQGVTISDEEFWFNKACNLGENNAAFRIFIWQPTLQIENELSPKQAIFINSIRNNLIQNMMFCKHASPVMFVEDIRSIVYEEQKVLFNTNSTNIFFIYNEIDEENGNNIVELLADVVNVKQLNISLRTEIDYSELIVQQMQKADLTTIYFSRTANWAVPFAQQVWKKIGGASANKNILMIGDANIDTNHNIKFNAPNVTNICTGTELIPLETKVFYDKLLNKQ